VSNKKSDKLDCKNYRRICPLNVTYKVFAKILYTTASYLMLTQPFSVTRLGSNQVNQQQTNSLHCANTTTHHLFIDFKTAYDTIITNEVYVGMSELNFPTK
jgi:hypothetical protein